MSEKNNFSDWLSLKSIPEWTKAKPLGSFIGFALLLLSFIALIVGLVAFGGLAKAVFTYVSGGENAKDASEAIRNIGLLLVAIVALPFTVYRLKLTTEQNKHNENVLYNDKLHAANSDLHSRYQATEWKRKDGYVHVWKDDIIRRNGAIDRLEALAKDAVEMNQTEMVPRIARILCVYLKEMTAEHPAEKMPDDLDGDAIFQWGWDLKVKRSDMETAAQVLGRLHEKTGVPAEKLAIDLSGVNLQAMTLSALNFEHATLNRARLDGTNLNRAELNGAKLNGAQLNGAQLNWAKLNGAVLNRAQLNGARLYEAYLNRAHLNGAKLNGAELSGARLHEAILNNAQLGGAELSGARLHEAILNNAQLGGAALNGAQFYEAQINQTVFDAMTNLITVKATGSALRSLNLTEVKNLNRLVTSAFGDASVKLPNDIKPLVKDKWPDTKLGFMEYREE